MQYPSFSKTKKVDVRVRSYADAEAVLRIRTLKLISHELRSFINMRHFAYVNSDSLTKERFQAIKRFRFIIDSYSEGSILKLATMVVNARVSLSVLMPIKPSPAKTHFETHIIPVMEYCSAVVNNEDKHNPRLGKVD